MIKENNVTQRKTKLYINTFFITLENLIFKLTTFNLYSI